MQSVRHRSAPHAPVSSPRKILLLLSLATSLAGCGGIDTRPAATAEAPAFQEQVPEIMPVF